MLVNLAGIILIGLIIWWFWIKKPQAYKPSSDVINITVENGVYSPARIEMKQGEKIKLVFLRKDPSPCAEKVIFDELGINLDLPLNKPVEVEIQPGSTGEFAFTCQMKMYVGSLAVSK